MALVTENVVEKQFYMILCSIQDVYSVFDLQRIPNWEINLRLLRIFFEKQTLSNLEIIRLINTKLEKIQRMDIWRRSKELWPEA